MKNNDEFPKLTILPDFSPPPQPRLTNSEKYGSLYWMGITGLIASILLVSWFAVNLWMMRDVWQAIYVLHDADSAVDARVQASEFLASDPRMEPSQIQPMIFRKSLPDKARYILAEHLDKALSAKDAGEMIQLLSTEGPTSPPNWLRGHLARLAVITLKPDSSFPVSTMTKFITDPDPIVADWAAFGLARCSDPKARQVGLDRLQIRAKEGSALATNLLISKDGQSVPEVFALNQAIKAMRVETSQNKAVAPVD